MARNKRILCLASLLKGFDTVVDIGSDHGYVLEEAFLQGYIKKGIATDVREMPLARSLKTLKNYPVKGILSDGFLAIHDPFDAAVIAGMGAYLIADLLVHAPNGDQTLILQPNDKESHLRQRLSELGFMITDEFVVHDRFYYVIIIAKRGSMTLSKEDVILGPCLKHKEEAIPFYQRRLKIMSEIMEKADDAKKEFMREEFQILSKHLSKIDVKE
jgi:tRNA (adenine22-N1)-methyltransferase